MIFFVFCFMRIMFATNVSDDCLDLEKMVDTVKELYGFLKSNHHDLKVIFETFTDCYNKKSYSLEAKKETELKQVYDSSLNSIFNIMKTEKKHYVLEMTEQFTDEMIQHLFIKVKENIKKLDLLISSCELMNYESEIFLCFKELFQKFSNEKEKNRHKIYYKLKNLSNGILEGIKQVLEFFEKNKLFDKSNNNEDFEINMLHQRNAIFSYWCLIKQIERFIFLVVEICYLEKNKPNKGFNFSFDSQIERFDLIPSLLNDLENYKCRNEPEFFELLFKATILTKICINTFYELLNEELSFTFNTHDSELQKKYAEKLTWYNDYVKANFPFDTILKKLNSFLDLNNVNEFLNYIDTIDFQKYQTEALLNFVKKQKEIEKKFEFNIYNIKNKLSKFKYDQFDDFKKLGEDFYNEIYETKFLFMKNRTELLNNKIIFACFHPRICLPSLLVEMRLGTNKFKKQQETALKKYNLLEKKVLDIQSSISNYLMKQTPFYYIFPTQLEDDQKKYVYCYKKLLYDDILKCNVELLPKISPLLFLLDLTTFNDEK